MTDVKVNTLYDNYRDHGRVQDLSRKVENLRRNAFFYGAVSTFSIFFANEMCRFVFRSPLFRLKPLNALIVLVAPTGFLKYTASEDIDKEVGKLWRIHKTREDLGLGGSYSPKGVYKDLMNENQLKGRFPIQINSYELLLGRKTQLNLDKPFERFSSNYEEYPDFHEDWDRDTLYQTMDETERLKHFKAKKGTVKSTWYAQPITDSETKVKFGGPAFENPWTEPPDTSLGPSVDQRQDERGMFAFNLNALNQRIVRNGWATEPTNHYLKGFAPFWIDKLMAPAWWSEDKHKELMAQMAIKSEFECLKAKQYLESRTSGSSSALNRKHKEELIQFLNYAYSEKAFRDMGSVFVTDRKHKPKRTFTNGEDEDMYRYQQKLLEFNADVEEKHDKMYFSQNRPKLHPFDQLAVDSFKSAKEFFENADKTGNKEGISSEPSNVLRSELAEIGEKLAKENEGEEYSAAKDMQEAYYKSLSTSLIDQIYQTIPEHAFWDIKAPLTKFTPAKINKYNSARPPTSYTFFDYRNNEEWMDRFKKKRNLRDSISLFRTY